ncbi:MAG: undecaprenyl-diphosphate phosphatase [Candidatus Vogelbacteria bacterium]|nr:undecaprenyl-diphosphate phosphatase [Candidatus Vogelbacteria bacterium]
MTWSQILILSIIEGVTEFLPVSSTGHLILVTRLLNITSSPFVTSFTVAIQLGAIMAAVILYGSKLWHNKKLASLAVIGFIPTGIIGFLFYSLVIKKLLTSPLVVVWTLIIGGLLLILFERWYQKHFQNIETKNLMDLTWSDAVIIGLVQAISIVPGVSRSAATTLAGLARGFSREAVVEFSFLLAIPTMLAATSYDLLRHGSIFNDNEWGALFLGGFISTIVAILSIKWLIKFIQTNSFVIFGFYRIVIGLIFALFLIGFF